MTFANGWTASVQWGAGTLTANRFNEPTKDDRRGSPTAEVAAWPADKPLYAFPGWGDSVKGYLTPEEVVEFLQMVAGMPASILMWDAT